MTNNFYVDGHVHIGRAMDGSPIKMAASKDLTISGILQNARRIKGLDLLGLIDAAAIPVVRELQQLIRAERLLALPGGGLLSPADGLTMMLGAEVEIAGPFGGSAHFGAFVGTMDALLELSNWLHLHQKNASLSSQRARATAPELGQLIKDLDGILIVNHAFTPHKGLYGNCVRHMNEMVPPEFVTAVELGLSADTAMADRVSELREFAFVTNSDAHSLINLAREYHVVELQELDFTHYKKALSFPQNRQIKANIGLWPELGKYHLSYCKVCHQRFEQTTSACPYCGSVKIVPGVWNRLMTIADHPKPISPDYRPTYRHHIPLRFIPGLGDKTLARLYQAFGTEMRILNEVPNEELREVVGEEMASAIDMARTGQWSMIPGAGGIYGRLLST